jgi:hypothetical protein
MSFDKAIETIVRFQGNGLTENLSDIEKRIQHNGLGAINDLCICSGIDDDFLASALEIKKIAGQINIIIHAAGILRSLQSILEPDEKVEYVSLGAGNTGRNFDLETNYRIAEYKFINWKGGAESIRQNGIFNDFFELAEYETEKKKFLYVVGTEFPLKFFKGERKLKSVLTRRPEILSRIISKYGTNIEKVSQYYDLKKDMVSICDLEPIIWNSDPDLSKSDSGMEQASTASQYENLEIPAFLRKLSPFGKLEKGTI